MQQTICFRQSTSKFAFPFFLSKLPCAILCEYFLKWKSLKKGWKLNSNDAHPRELKTNKLACLSPWCLCVATALQKLGVWRIQLTAIMCRDKIKTMCAAFAMCRRKEHHQTQPFSEIQLQDIYFWLLENFPQPAKFIVLCAAAWRAFWKDCPSKDPSCREPSSENFCPKPDSKYCFVGNSSNPLCNNCKLLSWDKKESLHVLASNVHFISKTHTRILQNCSSSILTFLSVRLNKNGRFYE